MKKKIKRIAYLGLSYPIVYDTTRQFVASRYGPSMPPHPILDSASGLVILYDELWFLSKDLCPINMQRLEFVKYVDEMFPDIPYKYLYNVSKEKIPPRRPEERAPVPLAIQEKTEQLVRQWDNGVGLFTGAQTYSDIKINGVDFIAETTPQAYLFDAFIVNELKRLVGQGVELVSNVAVPLSDYDNHEKDVELTDSIIIHHIPSILERYGPVTEGILQLRESEYLDDFRKWIIQNHQNIQKAEIEEMRKDVQHQVDEYRKNVFRKSIEAKSIKHYLLTGSKTVFELGVGLIPGVSTIYGIGAAARNFISEYNHMKESNNMRWSGFIDETESLSRKNKEE